MLQTPANFADGEPLYPNPVEDLSNDVCFFGHDFVTGLAVTLVFSDVVVTIGRAGEDSGSAHLGGVPLPTATAFHDLGPLILGHEMSGEIVELGELPKQLGIFKVGDRVAIDPVQYCNACEVCKKGWVNLCENKTVLGVSVDGAFAEYVVVPASNLWPIPDRIAPELAAFFDPFGNAAHCALQFDLVGEDVLITGAGPIGIIAAGICRHVGARR